MAESSKSPLKTWLDAQKGLPGFENALQKLLSFACAQWILKGTGQVVRPEEALAKVLAASLPEVPLGKWLDFPVRFATEIADFCEKSKDLPLPDTLKGEFSRILDLRGVKCPLNAARSRLVMAGLPRKSKIDIYLDEGSPIENVPGALIADGHFVEKRQKKENFWVLTVVKQV